MHTMALCFLSMRRGVSHTMFMHYGIIEYAYTVNKYKIIARKPISERKVIDMLSEMMQDLSGKQALALAGLVAGKSQKQTARDAGVSENTVARWLQQDQTFKAAYREAKRAALEQGIGALSAGFQDAVGTLRRNMHCAVPGVEVRAALGLIDRVMRGIEQTDLAEMIERLEQQDGDSDY